MSGNKLYKFKVKLMTWLLSKTIGIWLRLKKPRLWLKL